MGRLQTRLAYTCLALAAFGGGLLLADLAPDSVAQEAPKPKQQHIISEVLPHPVDFVRGRILSQFNSDDRSYYEDYNRYIYELPEKVLSYKDLSPAAYERFMALPMIKPDKFYVFFGAYQVKQKRLHAITPLSVTGIDNPALVKYAELPRHARSNDIYLWSPDVPFWFSEHEKEGKKLPFRSYFIVHLTAKGDSKTRVEVIQDSPVVRIAGKPSLNEHGTMLDYELRPVAPTISDREYLLSCIKQFIEREVPSRKQFNCKTNK